MQYQIVEANTEFAEQIAQLTGQLGYLVNTDETKQCLTELEQSERHCVFVALSQQSVLGWLVVEHRLSLEAGHRGEITGLVVDANHRRSGIAQSLVAAAEQWAKQRCLARIEVKSNAARAESHVFYPSVGYQLEKTSHSYAKNLTTS
ncbi:GNAT family N-acetyltransferase [Agarivorans sp.]|uniref:GNAT family N-acetyltransferase n=1 Tax=Agarivorans sp. TaxID=1872412 RepID=UPI003D00B8A8